ncbi:MAG TPA: DUF4389 domain-containing protein [Gaiellaceae bacterium]
MSDEAVSARPHPVRIVVADDDLARSRLTVFFRAILAIPHYLWAFLLGTVVFLVVFVNWFILLVKGRTPDGIHGFVAGYIRYLTHLEAYFLLAANPYPSFYVLDFKPYAIDLEVDPPEPQNRWKTFFRIFLAVPAIILGSTLFWGGPRGGSYAAGGLAFGAAFLVWWVALIRARSPRGLRDLLVYCLGYSAQVSAYLLLVTDRYPFAGPSAFVTRRAAAVDAAADAPPAHPVSLPVSDDLRRSRLLVFFRLPLAIPHIIWLLLWSIAAIVVAVLTWIWALATGRPPRPFHRFLSRYLRYTTHLYAFLFMVGNPFPGFLGAPGSYPVDLELPALEPQSRWVTGFRIFLAVPAILIGGGLSGAGFAAAFLGWFVGLFLGRMPEGLRDLGAYALRYQGQTNAYLYFVTGRYPDSAPRPDPASP